MRLRRVVPRFLLVAAICAWCGWVSGFHHSTIPALATWSASLASVAAVDFLFWRARRNNRLAIYLPPARKPWPRPGRGGASRTLVGVSPWLAFILVILAWEILGIDTSNGPHLTISALAQAFRPLDAALLLVWILVGLGYGAARARAPEDVSLRQGARTDGASPRTVAMVGLGHWVVTPALLLPKNRAAGVAFWVGVTVACILVELAARRSRGRIADAEEFVRLISGPAVANILLIAAWTYAGWHLFAH